MEVVDDSSFLQFIPKPHGSKPALVFICGSGVSASAYAPLLRPIAEDGYPVFIVKLPLRFAPLDTNKEVVIERAISLLRTHPEIPHWVLAGHSLGGALSCRAVELKSDAISAMVLVGTTHPKQVGLSWLTVPVTKVDASNDGVAAMDNVLLNKKLLPKDTQWIEIKGGNHSQFGHYGHQLFDGSATITREAQQSATRAALMDALEQATE